MYAHDRRLLLTHLKGLASPTRLRILEVLAEGELSVQELALRLRMSQPRVSWHLALLRRGGALQRRREGRQVFCSLDWDQVRRFQLMFWELLSQHRHIQSGLGPR
ncbi:MAG TPA: metalloregulator ArsR/SmtB family transcription factor [Candidatus Dormibacteraeota bacterium]|jgi:DNA-binding transcriptional ArsR family regulator|nr:metalloregulator ArsR/SmtB family transcription factor [Candidatus Dormibacteraeota bacterium]